jgi:hypothetical protein
MNSYLHHLSDQVDDAKGLTVEEKEIIRRRYSAKESKPE